MSKKHFIALADFIAWHNGSMLGKEEGFKASQIDTIAQFCQAQNPRFNRNRWIAYINGECGPNGGKR